MNIDELLAGYPVVVQNRVAWGDMDAQRHVNNVIYYRYFENARIAYYERIGKYGFQAQSGITFVLASNSCRYKAPVEYPDTLHIGARIAEIGTDRAVMKYLLVSERLERVAAEGDAVLVALDPARKTKVAFPEELKRRVLELQGTI
jgi:acyl-CoA thioester hydrolase